MSEKKSIFRSLDEYTFKKVDALKSSHLYQETMSKLNTLDDTQLKVINQTVSLTIISLPIFILIIILSVNISFNNKLELKREILTEVNSFTSAQKQLRSLGSNIIAGNAIANKNDFKRLVTSSLLTAGGKQSSLRVNDFESKPTEEIVKSNGVIKFSKLSTPVLASFMADLVDRGKFRISNLLIKKKLKDNVVSGLIGLQHYGRSPKGKQ